MRFVSVADRELRAAARQPASYRMRWITGLAFLGVLLWMLWIFSSLSNVRAGRSILQGLSVLSFFYCLLVGTARTADSISSERREGTLGLLFLTNLNSAEIVAGKLCSHALAGWYGLFAVFPILAVPLLIGGVTFAEFWKVVLALTATVIYAAAAGLAASVVYRKQFQAISLALGLALVFGVGPLGVAEAMRSARWPKELHEVIAAFSPLGALTSSGANAWVLGLSRYWLALALAAGVSCGWLGFAVWRLGRLWRDRPEQGWAWSWFRGGRGSMARRGEADRRLRGRLLGINPYFWLAGRQRVSAPVLLGLVVGAVAVDVWVWAPYCRRMMGGMTGELESYVFAWLWAAMFVHLLVTYYAALAASHRLAEDKQAGALELVLCTPTSERSIARGLWLAYGRRMAFPVLVAVLAHGFFVWMGATLIALEMPRGVPRGLGAGELLWRVWWGLPVNGQPLAWELGFMLRVVMWALVLLGAVWVTLGWVARWLGLSMKRPGFAPIASLGLVLVPPVLAFSFWCYLADQLDLDRLPERRFLPIMMWSAIVLQLGHCAALSAWAAGRLRRDFRVTVTRRFQPPSERAWWRPSRRGLLRLALGLGGVAALLAAGVAAFYLYQDRRARAAWVAFQQRMREQGQSLALADLLPEPVPDALNFAQSSAFRSFAPFARPGSAGAPNTLSQALGQVETESAWSPPAVHWADQEPSTFGPDLARLASGASSPSPTNRLAAASEVLVLLEPLAPALAELSTAARLPHFQATTNRTAAAVHQEERMALGHLERIHYLFQLRAQARLAIGQVDKANSDLATSFHLAALARQSPDARSPVRVLLMTARALQPIWDGLNEQTWRADHLVEIQRQLSSLNLLADYTNAVGRVVRAGIEVWEPLASRDRPFGSRPFPGMHNYSPIAESFQPRAWWLDRCRQGYEFGQRTLSRVDVDGGRVTGFLDWSEVINLPFSHDGVELLMLEANAWGPLTGRLPFVQNAINQATVACALERYRLAHGQYPPDLESLAPAWLNRLPPDVLTGRALGYEKTPDGRYRLRGVGLNLIDDRHRAASDDWIWAPRFPPSAIVEPPP